MSGKPTISGIPAVAAAADLVGRTGALKFEIGYEEGPQLWFALADYGDAGTLTRFARSPSLAASALAARILNGGQCACGRTVVTEPLDVSQETCLWTLTGDKWVRGCDAPTLEMKRGLTVRGDFDKVRQVLNDRKGNYQ